MQDVPAKDRGSHAQRLGWRQRRWRIWVLAGLVIGLLVVLALLLTGKDSPISDPEVSLPARHPAAIAHAPPFITPPGSPDVLLAVMAVVLVGAVLAIGVFFFWLHSLPERMVYNSTKVHFDIVAVLGLLSLFTHIHLFWVAALLLALVKMPQWSIPDFASLLGRIASAIEGRSRVQPSRDGTDKKRQHAPVQEG